MLALLSSDCGARAGPAADLLRPVPLARVDKRDSRLSKSNTLADGSPCQESSGPPTCHCKMRRTFGSLGFLKVFSKSASKLGFRAGSPQTPHPELRRRGDRGRKGRSLPLVCKVANKRCSMSFQSPLEVCLFFPENFQWTFKEIRKFHCLSQFLYGYPPNKSQNSRPRPNWGRQQRWVGGLIFQAAEETRFRESSPLPPGTQGLPSPKQQLHCARPLASSSKQRVSAQKSRGHRSDFEARADLICTGPW